MNSRRQMERQRFEDAGEVEVIVKVKGKALT
jgi:hypothetical protein